MSGTTVALPPEVARVSGLYRFIPPERFEELGIDPEDVPLGTFPAEDHPPFLPDRFGGNAYGLGLYEQSVLPPEHAHVLETLDLSDQDQAAANYRTINDIFKRLGLLIRYSQKGLPFFLIPRQYVAHFLVEVQARTDQIVTFLSGLLSRRLSESLRVGIVVSGNELLVPEVQARMPHLEFKIIDSLSALAARQGPFAAMIMVGDPLAFVRAQRGAPEQPEQHPDREANGYFITSRLWDMLEDTGEVLCLADCPLGPSNENVNVRFASQGELKRFLMFSHVYRTRRRYKSGKGLELKVNRFDFNTFLSGISIYHETVEGLLEGRSLAMVEPREIDRLPYQDLSLPRGSAESALAAWQRWFSPFFELHRRVATLPEVQRREWKTRYELEGYFPDTLLVLEGRRRRPAVSYANLESRLQSQRIAGCDRGLLAGYKDSFAYVRKVLDLLEEVRKGTLRGLPGLELSRLRKPFETARRHPALHDVFKLMALAPRLGRMENRLNPEGLAGPRTPVLSNLEKLSLMGLEEGPLLQLSLIVLGHSTMARVTFGKLPETTLEPLTDLGSYRNLEEAVTMIRLYRLLSVAEAAAASPSGLTNEQVAELFSLYDDAIRVVTDLGFDWQDLLNQQISRLGGVQAKAFRKMLKLFNLFEYLDSWQALEQAGPRLKEAMAGFDPAKLERIGQVVELANQGRQFVERFYAGDSMARPYFLRALLNCEMHGTGRLLPRLGATAGFKLLWICVHTSEKRLLNFNRLIEVGGQSELDERLDKLRLALNRLEPGQLSPRWLASLRGAMAEGSEAYILDSGIYLTLDKTTGALTPRFLDVADELGRVKAEMDHGLAVELSQVSDERLQALDRGLYEVQRFLAAQGRRRPGKDLGAERLLEMVRQENRLSRRLENYLLSELFDLPRFAVNLKRLMLNCPRVMDRLLPRPAGQPRTWRCLRAAQKLSALYMRRLDLFQDMYKSHETARAEFGATAAGIVGVSPLQFQTLTASLAQLLAGGAKYQLAELLMLAVLLRGQGPNTLSGHDLAIHPLVRAQGLGKRQLADLSFLLEHHGVFGQIINGESTSLNLESLLGEQDQPLLEALFLLSVIFTAASQESSFTEDLLERFFWLLQKVRGLVRQGKEARQAHQASLEEYARQLLALAHYRDIQNGEAPTSSLRHLLETTQLPAQDREQWLRRGAEQAGVERILKMRGLLFVSWLDLELLRQHVPVVYIYRLKGMRSMGITHFERDLYEALRIHRGLAGLRQEHRSYLLMNLGDPQRALSFGDYAQAAERLAYPNQVRLLLLGLAAAQELQWDRPPERVSYAPLARVMERKFEMVNEAITSLSMDEVLARPQSLSRLQGAKEGLRLRYDPAARELSLAIADPVSLDRKLEAVRRAKDPQKLKRLYHQELKKIKLTHYHTLDFGERLEKAFQENLARLGEQMMERAREKMARTESLGSLEGLFRQAWEEGLELPLSRDRQQSLRDIYELNSERIRTNFLGSVSSQLNEVSNLEELDSLWARVKKDLASQDRNLGQDFDLIVAQRFDRRAWELSQKS
ncbi:hypothetical protein AAU61_15770 [Desulfocarbo indianensis]|nr:hypothetical protein AAU61_15770 [Desulfocarbo indianensis]